ncbi:protein SODIUM POTASSIUM ROOT DEFECTIVE 2-like [Momordica charantia]|uniref:Protein SODIUM POTASSIUM ROOT DEFECTIVE 2-like n=1 Tax=Momordica charantia TaxID=3673 RepID=A0A6J1CRH8_MOMCH|nr:protein SODIUM POTASSIUM ROOT DEFECTIVE 2-like [Momordica charantia]
MKGVDMLCASQASTAVCLPLPTTAAAADQPSSSPLQPGAGAAIDRHNPIISGGRRITSRIATTFPNPPCSSQYSPINPLPYHHLHASPAAAAAATQDPLNKIKKKKKTSIITTDLVRWSCAKPSDLATPPGSMRYLLNDKSFRDGSMDRLSKSILQSESHLKVTSSIENNRDESKSTIEISEAKTPSPSNQVVVLRVSLHCRGCEGKLRKHLSKMEGVNSFNIDFAAKMVTIMGNITPQGVLESVSKVKNAQFWPTSDPLQNLNLNPHQKNMLKNF